MNQLVIRSEELSSWPVINAWIEQASRSRSNCTRTDYKRRLLQFAQMVPLDQATPAHVQAFAYGKGLSGKDPSASTVIGRLAALNSFYGWVQDITGHPNPCVKVKRPRLLDPIPHGLEADELEAFMETIPNTTPAGLRDRAIILTIAYTGLRRAEVMSLRRCDITRNGDGRVYYNCKVKGGEIRHMELPPPAFDAISAALEAQHRPLSSLADDAKIFDISGATFYAYLRKWAKRAGITLRPHDLRHTAAKLRPDETLQEMSWFMGHKNMATTARYLERLRGKEDHGWQRVADRLALARQKRLEGTATSLDDISSNKYKPRGRTTPHSYGALCLEPHLHIDH